jgi:hypothetical protein
MTRSRSDWVRAAVAVVLALWSLLTFMIATGAWSLTDECSNSGSVDVLGCGQLLQAVLGAVAGVALAYGASRVIRARSATYVILFGTMPLLLVHVYFWLTDPHESVFFPLVTAPPPTAAAVVLLKGARHRGAASGDSDSPTGSSAPL